VARTLARLRQREAQLAQAPEDALPLGRIDHDAKRFTRSTTAKGNFIASAPGYGQVRFSVKNLEPGETPNLAITFPTNLASATSGANATGDGTPLGNLIDGSEATIWCATGAPLAGRQVVVDLAATSPVEIGRINVSAQLAGVPAPNRFIALRSFEVWACTAGRPVNPTCDGSTDAGWKRILKSADDAFPSVNPRPVAPDLALRSWGVERQAATHLKFVVSTNQCTGQTSYQGDQDNDPAVNADCRNPPGTGTTRATEVRAAEFQAFSDNPSADGTGVTVG